jgi:pimeloyl-ACP methyl ester carboxylesterase
MNTDLAGSERSIRHGYVQVGGVRLHYAECGAGERLVLLLHGFPEFWYSWRHQLVALADRYRVVAPDLRGYNLSDKPRRVEDYRLDRLMDDVTGLIRHFGAREAAIVAHDWGAIIAWAVAEKYPEYVWKLATMQVPPIYVWRKNLTLKQALRSWYMLFFQLPWLPEWYMSAGDFKSVDSMFKNPSVRPGSFTDTDIAMYKEALRRDGALTAGINYYRANIFSLFMRASRKSDVEELSDERLRVPTLFIYGERDLAVVPETVRGVGDYIDAPYREVRIATSGHWVQNEAPLEVNDALAEFLDAP